MPDDFPSEKLIVSTVFENRKDSLKNVFSYGFVSLVNSQYPILGGYCGGVPPLPIPNREVKPTCADGTAMQCGRVGGRLL